MGVGDMARITRGDCLHLPRIHPGAVPVYDSVDSVNSLLVLNKALARLSPLVILAISPAPTLALGFYLLGLYSYHVLSSRVSNSSGSGVSTWWSRRSSCPTPRSWHIRK